MFSRSATSKVVALGLRLFVDVDILTASSINNKDNYCKHLFYYLQLGEDTI